MKQYPSIDVEPRFGAPCYVFPKYDGSNIRAEWTRKKGFDKFGSRKVLIGSDAMLGGAIDLVRRQEDDLARIFSKQRWDKVTCFFEYFGENSFAGLHELTAPMHVILIDADIFKRGQMDPREFIKVFGEHGAPCIGSRFNQEMADQVRVGTYEGQTFEGVVCKVPSDRPWQPPYMFKVKNRAWIDKVHALHGDKAAEYL